MDQVLLYIGAFGNAIIANAPFLVGFVMPPFVEVLNRDVKGKGAQAVIAFLACFLAAVLLHWNEIAFGNPEQVVAITGIFFTESHLLYKLYFERSSIRYRIQDRLGITEERGHETMENPAPPENATPPEFVQ